MCCVSPPVSATETQLCSVSAAGSVHHTLVPHILLTHCVSDEIMFYSTEEGSQLAARLFYIIHWKTIDGGKITTTDLTSEQHWLRPC